MKVLADQAVHAGPAGTVYWSSMPGHPSGHFWNKLGTFLWILEYDLQLGRKVVQCYDPQIGDSFLTIGIIIHCGRLPLHESHKYRLRHGSRCAY